MTLKDYLPWIPDGKTFSIQDKEVKDLVCGVFQNNSLSGPQSSSGNQEDFFYSDRFGNFYTKSEINFNPAGGGGCPNSGHFDLDFGPGFTDYEITTICQVFIDVSALFTSQQSDIPILVNRENLGEGAYAAASGFWRADIPAGGCGVENNLVWEHINTSADFAAILEPNYAAGEFRVNTNLGQGLNWHTQAMDPLVPGTNFIDLYSVTLYEVMHMLGFYSRITPDGSPLNGFYSPWDRQLIGVFPDLPSPVTTATNLLVPDATDPECCDAHEYNAAIGAAPSLLDLGCAPLTENVISYLYGPAATDVATVRGEYNNGEIPDPTDEIINILSHLDSGCDAPDYVMHARFTIGETRRILTTPELDILCNLGYSLIAAPTTTCEEACNVVAMDDFIDSGFNFGSSISLTMYYDDIIQIVFLPPGSFSIDFAVWTIFSPDGFQCIESGIVLDNTMNSPVTYDNITWTNNTPHAIYYILVANHAAVLVGPTGQSNGPVLVDNITVTQECSNELIVEATVTEMCAQNQIIIDYKVCLEGDNTGPATDIVLTVDLPNIPGLAFGNGDFQSETFTIPGVVPNEPEPSCTNVSLVLDLTNSSVVEGNNLQFTLEALANNSCIEGPIVTNVTAVDCITSQTCPCEGSNAIEVIAGGGTYWQNTALGPMAGSDLFSPNAIDLSAYCVTIRGRLLIGSDPMTQSFQSDLLFGNGALRMLPDAEIVIEDGASMMLFSVNEPDDQGTGLHGCEFMWQGITVETGGELRMYDSHIEDAEIAVQAFPGATLDIFGNDFVDNYVGLDIIGSVNNDPPGTVNVGINGIEKNLFDGMTGLLGTSNYSIQMGDEAYAGVRLNDVSFLMVGSFNGEGNFFRGLQHGVFSANSNYSFIQADMQDIAVAGLSSTKDFVLFYDAKMERMPFGIDIEAGSISASNNTMSQISDTGIRVFGADGMDVGVFEINNNTIDADRFCIDLTSTLDNNNLTVQGNQLTLTPLAASTTTYEERAAFRMLNAGTDNAGFNLQAQIRNNDITVHSAGIGIDIMDIGKINLHYNDITFYNPVEMMDGVYRGISLDDSDNNYLYDNSTQVGAFSADFTELVGYHFTACQTTRLCCNSSDGGYIGFEFSENCMDTEWRTSEIFDHQIGLRINEGSNIGVQKYAGNRWNSNSYTASAEHLSSSFLLIQQSRIIIRSPFPPLFPAIPPATPFALGADWFTLNDETSDAVCGTDPSCLPIPPPFNGLIKETDRFLAGTTYQGAPYESFHDWEGRKFLLTKLDANASYWQGDVQLQQFYNNQNGSLLQGYLNLNEQMNAVHQGQTTQALVHLDAVKTHLVNLKNLETQYLQATTDTERADLQEDYADTNADIVTELTQLRSLQQTAKTNREATATNLITANDILATPDIFTANQQTVNAIQLDIWAGILPALGSSEISTLEQIAYQCPLEGGNAVHRARAMLRGIGEYNFQGVNCVSAQALQGENSNDSPATDRKLSGVDDEATDPASWRIYPNPTSNYLRISGEYLEELQSVELYDLSGKLHQTWLVASTGSSYQLSNNLAAGIYLLRLHLTDGSQVNRKLVISK